MSEHTVDILVRARETAIQTMREVNQEIQRTGKMTEETRKAYVGARQEIVQQNRALNTLRLAYREQTQTLEMTATAFQSIATTVGKAQRMYEQYNVAQIKTNQLAQQVRDAQEKYNAAVLQFGPNSQQAIKAQNDLKDASEKLATAQKENVLQLIGFGLQAPAFLKNILDMKTNFQLLAFQLGQVNWAQWGTNVASACGVAATGVKGLATAFGVLTVETTAALGAGYAMVKLLETFGGPLAQRAIERWKILLGFRSPEEPLTPLPTPGPTACPYCGQVGGHAPWCPILSNEWYGFQQGGIVTRPTLALLGERGPEAVVPLGGGGGGGPMRTEVNINNYISSLHVSSEQEVQKFFDRLQRKIVTALR